MEFIRTSNNITMLVDDYQEAANRTLVDKFEKGLTENETMLIWNTLGLAGEAGEVADNIKKAIFHERKINKVQVKKELGDVLWYIAALCENLGFTMEDVASTNINKLKKRYPNGFTVKDSKERRDLDESK